MDTGERKTAPVVKRMGHSVYLYNTISKSDACALPYANNILAWKLQVERRKTAQFRIKDGQQMRSKQGEVLHTGHMACRM